MSHLLIFKAIIGTARSTKDIQSLDRHKQISEASGALRGARKKLILFIKQIYRFNYTSK